MPIGRQTPVIPVHCRPHCRPVYNTGGLSSHSACTYLEGGHGHRTFFVTTKYMYLPITYVLSMHVFTFNRDAVNSSTASEGIL